MHILQITKYFYPALSFGGPVQCTYNLSKYLVRRGHKVTVYSTDALDISADDRIKEKSHQIDGIQVFYFSNVAKLYGMFFSPSMICSLQENINNFDVVHLHEYRTFQNLVFYYLNQNRVPYVLSCHGEFRYKKESWDQLFLRRLFEYSCGQKIVNDADKLHALTQFEAAQYLDAGIEQDKISIVPNGVAPEDFLNVPPIGTFKKLYGITKDVIILYLGRIHKQKGIDILVKSFSLLSKEQVNVKLVVAGPDDGFLASLKKLVEELDLSEKVLFTGSLNRKRVLAAYNDAAVVVYPSLHEGFAVVPLEAGIMGKPVIVSNAPALDFVRKGRFGLIAEYGNIIQLKNSLATILNNPDISRTFGKNGKEFVTRNYSWDVIGKKTEEMYYSVLH